MPKRRFYQSANDSYQSVLFPDEEKTDDQNDPENSDNDDEQLSDSDNQSGSEIDLPQDGSDEDEDDVPESVSFLSSRQSAIAQMKSALKQIGQEKQKIKEKRKKQDEQFKEQKKKKLEEIAMKRLPEEFLNDLEDKNYLQQNEKKAIKSSNPVRTQIEMADDDEESFADTEEELECTPEFIPLENDRLGGVDVQTVKEYHKTTQSTIEKAKTFKHSHLYGGKIRRETTRSKFAKIGKRKARFR